MKKLTNKEINYTWFLDCPNRDLYSPVNILYYMLLVTYISLVVGKKNSTAFERNSKIADCDPRLFYQKASFNDADLPPHME